MTIPTFDDQALIDACRTVAKRTLWQTPNPQNVHDIVTREEIDSLTIRLFHEAEFHVQQVTTLGGDPNLVTRAVIYLAAAHAMPPIGDDVQWFDRSLEVLVELACPNTLIKGEATAIFTDIREGMEWLARAAEHEDT